MAVERPVPGVPGMPGRREKKTIGPTSQEARDANEGKLVPTGLENILQRLAKSWAVRLGIATTVVGGGAYAAYQNVPAIHEKVNGLFGQETVVTTPPFDVGKLDKGPQSLVLGKNAQEATPEQIQSIIHSPLPDLKIGITPNAAENQNLPTLEVQLSIDLPKAGKVEVSRKSTGGVAMNLYITIENPNTSLGLVTFEGMNTDTAEIFRLGDNYTIVEKFNLGDSKHILLEVGGNFTLTDAIKGAPLIDPAHSKYGNWVQDILATTGQKFNVDDKSALFTTAATTAKSEITIKPFYLNGTQGNPEPISPSVQNGSFLFSTPTSTG